MTNEVIYNIKAPDGSILHIQGPSGATEEELQGVAQQHFDLLKKQPIEQTKEQPKKEEPTNYGNVDIMGNPTDATLAPIGATLMSGATGILKPFAGAMQYLGVNAPAEKLNELSKETSKIGGTSADIANIIGEVSSPLPIKGASALEKVAPILGKNAITKGATQAGVSSLLNPTDTNDSYKDFLGKHIQNLLTDVPLGGAVGQISKSLLNPQVSAEMQLLKNMGMKYFTPGQLLSGMPILGKGFQKAEKALTSLPITGSMVASGLKTSFEDFNKSMGNKVLNQIDEKLPKDIRGGNEMIEHIQNRIDDVYSNVTKNITLTNHYDPKSQTNTIEYLWGGLQKAMHPLLDNQQRIFEKDIVNNIIKRIEETPVVSGEVFRNMEKHLGNEAYKSFQNGEEALGNAYQKFQDKLRKELKIQNPQVAKELSKIHNAFKMFQPIEKASAMRGAEEGLFAPDQFKSATASSAGKKGTASGQGMFIPESQAASSILGKTIPDSGTASRLLTAEGLKKLALGLGGEYVGHALTGFGLPIAGASLYNKPVMGALTKFATERPQAIQQAQPVISGALSRGVSTINNTAE